MPKVLLEYRDASSQKFWEIEVVGASHRVRFGKIDAQGQTKLKTFASEEDAHAAAEKLVAEKKRGGYCDVAAGDAPTSVEPVTTKSSTAETAELRGALFVKAHDRLSASDLVSKLREDGKMSKTRPESLAGFDERGLVGIAVHPVKDGYFSVVDSADGAAGIGAGAWSRAAMMANHLGTDVVWFRAIDPSLAAAVHFVRGGDAFAVFVGSEEEVRARLASMDLPLAAAKPPSAAPKGSTLFAIEYDAKTYRSGPDAAMVAELGALRGELERGDSAAAKKHFESLDEQGRALALGVLRGAAASSPSARKTITALARSITGAAPRFRTNVKELTLDEEAVRLAAEQAAQSEDDALFDACVARLDEIETEVERRSKWSGAAGLWRLAAALQTAGKPRHAFACWSRLVRRDDEPHAGHVNAALLTLLLSRTGKIALTGEIADLVARCEKRLADVGTEAQDAVLYNLGCVFARAGDPARALDRLKRCRDLRKQNAKPEADSDLASLWKNPAFIALLGPKRKATQTATFPVDELELSVRATEVLQEKNVKMVPDILRLEPSEVPRNVRAEISALLDEKFGLKWGGGAAQGAAPDEDEPGGDLRPPAARAVARQAIKLKDGKGSALVSRMGGLPNAPRDAAEWPETDQRPMQFVLQLVGKKAGGAIDLGPLTVIQIFADLEGDYYDPGWHRVVMLREPCPAVLEAPVGVAPLPVRVMTFTDGFDDRAVLDVRDPDDEDALAAIGIDEGGLDEAQSHAWCDKVRGIPVGANMDPVQNDSRGRPMELLLMLVTYDDAFLWGLFVSPDFSEAKLEIVRG